MQFTWDQSLLALLVLSLKSLQFFVRDIEDHFFFLFFSTINLEFLEQSIWKIY